MHPIIDKTVSRFRRGADNWLLERQTVGIRIYAAVRAVWNITLIEHAGVTAFSLWLISIASAALCACDSSIAWLGLTALCVAGYGTILLRSQAARRQLEDLVLWLAHKALVVLKMPFGRSSSPEAHEYVYRFHGLRRSSHGAWQGSCKCGWNSKPRPEDHVIHDEYREHISRELGRKARYTAPVLCGNCSYRGPVKQFVGMPVSDAGCPRCGQNCLTAPEPREQHTHPRSDCTPELTVGDSASDLADRLLNDGREQEYVSRMTRRLPG
jgi:hypothetical protein